MSQRQQKMQQNATIICKDCIREGVERPRPAPWPGPRCTTHWRLEQKRRKLAAQERHRQKTYGLSSEQFDAILIEQDGVCYGCGRAKGISRALCVDHDHSLCDDHEPTHGCPKCVRALLCGFCNDVIGRLDAPALGRLAEVLGSDPPARRALRRLAEIRPA